MLRHPCKKAFGYQPEQQDISYGHGIRKVWVEILVHKTVTIKIQYIIILHENKLIFFFIVWTKLRYICVCVYIYIFKFLFQQSPSVTYLNVLNFHCGKRGHTTGILGCLYNSWNITFQDVLWTCTSIKWRHACDFLIECVKNTICVIFSACRKFEKRSTQKVGIQLLFLSHSPAPSHITQCCDVQKPTVLIVKCFVAGKENINITHHWLPVLLWWNINEKFMLQYIVKQNVCFANISMACTWRNQIQLSSLMIINSEPLQISTQTKPGNQVFCSFYLQLLLNRKTAIISTNIINHILVDR